jgi:iron(III) transport system substrate-binding protein
MLFEKYGEPFFAGLRAQSPRTYGSSVATIQALAAGEGSIALPTIEAAVMAFKVKGAPLEIMTPDATTGVEMQLILTARARAPHPNAARLFANYIMSREGNTVLNSDPGAVTMYDTTRLPKQYVSPRPDALAWKEQIYKLLGQ